MIFERKATEKLHEWKNRFADSYAVLLEGARRVGKSTIAEQFARSEYQSYVLIDFANVSPTVLSCFDDIHDLDLFFLRLQAATGVSLIEHDSVVIFDEIQLFPKARQAIKYLVKDGRYHYIETGSLISIKKNVKDILIPSEEMKVNVYPMDFEEFCWATKKNTFNVSKKLYLEGIPVGQSLNRQLMKDFRLYMGVGGMPQAVDAFIQGKNFSEIDEVKRTIIKLYEDDFNKIDPSGRVSAMYHSIPAQLSKDRKKYYLSEAITSKIRTKEVELLYELIDSKTVLICHNTTSPEVSLSQTKDVDSYKLYLSDVGLFVTLLYIDRPNVENTIYEKLLSDKLPSNLGYLYENAVAQVIQTTDRELYYHTWEKPNSTHYHEIDFLFTEGNKVSAIEVKSSGVGRFESLREFKKKYSKYVKNSYLLSQKDRKKESDIQFLPIYMAPFIFETL